MLPKAKQVLKHKILPLQTMYRVLFKPYGFSIKQTHKR